VIASRSCSMKRSARSTRWRTSLSVISPVIMRRRAAYRRLRCVAARGSDGRRPRKSPLHRFDHVHVGCKKLAPALASMDDKRMLHPFRALAPDLK
jgi:hypothetical protein